MTIVSPRPWPASASRLSRTVVRPDVLVLPDPGPSPCPCSANVEEGAFSQTQAAGSTHLPLHCTNLQHLKARFSATVGEEPEVEVALVQRLRACVQVTCLRAS